MDEGNSRRSLSPYHEKCFPPYCDNAQQIDKAMVSKMGRGDLEDKYIIFADENLELKKQNRNQERQIQRLQTAIQRQDKMDKRSGLTPTSVMADCNKIAILESQNKHLQAKVKVLKQQLMNHSFIHSKESRINDAKLRQGQVKTPRESEFNIPSQTQSAREAKPDRNVAALKMRVAELEDQLETQRNKYKARLAHMEKELAALEKEAGKSGTSVNEQLSETSRQVKDNTELIKLRMQVEKQAAELEDLRDKLRSAEEETEKLRQELKDSKEKVDDLEKQLEKERNKSRSAISIASKGTTHMETIRALEEQIRDLQKEKETLKDTNEKLLQLTQSKSERSLKTSGHSLQISQLEKTLREKTEELEEKEAKIRELEQDLAEARKEKSLVVPSQSVKSIQADVIGTTQADVTISQLEKTLKEKTEELEEKEAKIRELEQDLAEARKEKSLVVPSQSFKSIQANLIGTTQADVTTETDLPSKECDNCVDLSKQLTSALIDIAKLKVIQDQRPRTPPPTPKSTESDEALKNLNQRLEEELTKALQELSVLRPIAQEHKSCQKSFPDTSVKSMQFPLPTSHVSFKEITEVAHNLSPVHSDDSVHSRKTIDSERYIALTRQLQEALWENERLKKQLEGRDGDEDLKRQNQNLEDELNRALRELREVRPIAEEHNKNCAVIRREIITKEYSQHAGEHLEPEYHTEVSTIETHHIHQTSPVPSYALKESPVPSDALGASPVPSYALKASPDPSYTSRDNQERRKQKWPDAKSVVLNSRMEGKVQENTEKKLPNVTEENQNTNEESGREGSCAIVEVKQEHLGGEHKGKGSSSFHGESKVIQTKNDTMIRADSQSELESGSSLKEEKTELKHIESANAQLDSLFEISTMLEEIESEFQLSENLEKDTADTQLKNKELSNESPSRTFGSQSGDAGWTPQLAPLANTKRLLRRQARPPLRSSTLTLTSPPAEEDEERQGYISHVSPPPSEHCVKTVDINDPAQRANLVIVSKHDFETVLMQKKKFVTEVEMMEPVDDKQALNCKLEICMYDLDIDERMMEYLSSLQSEPRVYVEWSFVGLDQRTAPLPAEQALFYTNVMYFGPLSNEIKNYLNKVEMPIHLYLVKSSGHPQMVAEGTLDMLPAMEQPNRGFIRSVTLRGRDLPSKYASDRAVATIHCSFILHECCLGDPPFRDQMEVAIGTLYLKNRDGGVVPDHATHIYIEYALLGHCGPDLETDSVPRGEVMKFNHIKKLRVNDENAPHLKAMLVDHDPKPLRFTVCAEPCSLTTDTEVETVGYADVNLNEAMIMKGQDLVSSQVPVYSKEGENLGYLSVTVLGIGTMQQIRADDRVRAR